VGGRIKTDLHAGYLLDRGFQVLQTAYPEARRVLDFSRLNLHCFAPGAMIRIGGRFSTVADPLRCPKALLGTLRASNGRRFPVGEPPMRSRPICEVAPFSNADHRMASIGPEKAKADMATGGNHYCHHRLIISVGRLLSMDLHIKWHIFT
jgi:hypothetical protein